MKRSYVTCLALIVALVLSACGGAPAPTTAPTSIAAQPTTGVANNGATAAATDAGAPDAAATDEIVVEAVDPTAVPTKSAMVGTPEAGGTGNLNGTPVAFGTPKGPFKPPTSLDDLKKEYPDLASYIDSIKDKQWNGIDLADLYKRVVDIYNKNGATGLATFLKESGILEKLNIPLSYLDLLIAYGDKGDMAAVEKLARTRQLINSKNEVVGYLTIDAPESKDGVTKDLQALGVSVNGYDVNREEVEIGIPLSVLSQLQTPSKLLDYLVKIANTPHVAGFRVPEPMITKTFTITQAQTFASTGAKTIGADLWQKAGITGKGIKIGILDMGFGGVLKAVGRQLPDADQIQSFQPLEELNRQPQVHGTACAIVVHGAAPEAELYLAQFDGSSSDSFVDAVSWLLDQKVQIINYSVGSPVGPRDGSFGQALAVDAIVQETGVLWVNAAGNEATDHSMFQYSDNGEGLHSFGQQDGQDQVAIPFIAGEPETSVIMNWNGNWNGKEKSEYNFVVYDSDQNEVVTAAEAKRGRKSDYPFQAVSFEANPGDVYYLVIGRTRGTEDHVIDIFIPNGLIQPWAQVADHSVTVPGDSNSAFTVGATGLSEDKIEEYSSQGPTNDDRIKPDISAPTGEVVSVYPEGFFGTSGAAPLVAGAAGLVMQKFPDMSAEEVRAYLLDNSLDLGDSGEDPVFGKGRLTLPAPEGVKSDDPGTVDNPEVGAATDVAATIVNVETKLNLKQKGVKGLGVNVSFEIANFKGKEGYIAVLFFDKNGKQIPSKDKTYTVGKGLGTARTFKPKFDKTAFDDVLVFFPNTAFSGIPKGTTEIYYIVGILDPDNLDTPLAVSEKFKVKIKK
jgi:hypothetical protein